MKLRAANKQESGFLARCVLAGIGVHEFCTREDMMLLEAIEDECGSDDSLYSYRHMIVAEEHGQALGMVLSYPGEIYPEARRLTWERLDTRLGEDTDGISDPETGAGEYYIDTLALLPQYRGMGYGKALIYKAIEMAVSLGYTRITLIVEQDYKRLISYYESFGFARESELVFLGDNYYKCVLNLTPQEQHSAIQAVSPQEHKAVIRRATVKDIPMIMAMADEVFRATYKDIISPQQMEFMMQWMYSPQSLEKQINADGKAFFVACLDHRPCGYVSVEHERTLENGRELFHLQKLYVMPSFQGRGLGRQLFDHVVDYLRDNVRGPFRVELNVNRENRAVQFYEHMGMKRDRQGDFPIGNGFFMTDYIYALDVA